MPSERPSARQPLNPRPLLTRGDVADLLGIPLHQLTWWVWALDEDRQYRSFEIQRRDGRTRSISAPIKPIKDIQRRLADVLTAWYAPPAQVHGFVPERSPFSNALPHRRQQWVLRVDLQDFFPSIHFGRVRGLFMAFPFHYPADVATLLAQICCHRKELPQGAPTSPMISNFICRGMDAQIARLARAERCYYTRYADDITFSTDRTVFPSAIAFMDGAITVAGPAITDLVAQSGFSVNPAKVHLTRRTQRQRVTGLVVNYKLNVSGDYIRSLRNVLYIWRKYGREAAEQSFARANPRPNWPPNKPQPNFELVVRGRVQYVGSVKGWANPVYTRLAAALGSVDEEFRAPAPSPFSEPQRVMVYTEGVTDRDHLRAALTDFHARGEFTDLRLEFDDDWEPNGDSHLRRKLAELPASHLEVPSVCLFDRDNEQLLKELGLHQADWKDVGNGVVAAALVVPSFRAEPLCVEMLYADDDLARTNDDGRRLHLSSEFDPRSGHHTAGDRSIPQPKSKTLVREDVFEFGTGKSLGLSKADFAACVLTRAAPFAEASFEGFRPTVDMLVEAVAAVAYKAAGSGRRAPRRPRSARPVPRPERT